MTSTTVAVFGASGRTGRCLIEVAENAGLQTRGLTRSAGALSTTSAREVVGSLTDSDSIEETLDGCAAACVVIGPHPPYAEIFCARATEAIVAAMKRVGVVRLLCQTGAMIGAYPDNRSWFFQIFSDIYRRRQPLGYEDRVLQEHHVRESGLEWTIIKPPRLTMKPRSRHLHIGPNVRVGMFSEVSRRDLAVLMVNEILQPRFVGRAVFVHG